MHDYELKDFAQDVLEASRHVPVLVDFWAPWCGPCKMLGPLVEKLAAQAGGKWKLVKVNTEAHPVIASEYGISSIPNLKLFHHGKVIDELPGFLPEAQLKQWIEGALPSPNAQALAEARELLDAGKVREAAGLLEPVVAAEPGNERAKVFLAEAVLVDQPARAVELLASVHEDSDFFTQATAMREVAGLCSTQIGKLPSGKGQPGYLAAREALIRRDYAAVMAGVIASLEESGRYAEGAAGKLGRAIVKLLGIRHPVIDQCYRRFSSLLYS
jgi:putative thioredoxin